MQNNFFLATIIKNKPDGEHQEKNLDQNGKTCACRYKITWATDTDDFSFYTSEATFITKNSLLDLSHRLKERQARFGGMAIASPCSRAGVNQVEGDHRRSQSKPHARQVPTPPSQPPGASSERHRAPCTASTSDQARPKLTHQGPCVSGRGLRNNAAASLAERYGR